MTEAIHMGAERVSDWHAVNPSDGITHVFGMVGHSNLGFADALRRAEERGELTFVGIRHEGAAAFAAGAFGKLTGRPAACVAIARPGSTNLLTGLYDAKLDQAPVLAVSGQVPSKNLGCGAFGGPRSLSGLPRRGRLDDVGGRRQRPPRIGGPGGEARSRRPRCRPLGASGRSADPSQPPAGGQPPGPRRGAPHEA
jgi:hypothetical protein